ncbi:hypothetical protein AH97_03470 [Salmonella enterica subsp. enterica]|nr:hypothetical protein [Salmonella enterica subsp. enterica serovar Hartford]
MNKITIFIVATILITGCNRSAKIISPPHYDNTPVKISAFETAGLTFVKTISYEGIFAEKHIKDYAQDNNIRYYVIVQQKPFGSEKITAMLYK